MKETFKHNFIGVGLVVLFAALFMAVVVFRQMSPALAQGDDLPKVQAGSEWNDLSSDNIHPTFLEAKEKYQAVVPAKERDFAVRRINHIIAAPFSSTEYANNLLPLKGWQNKNVFLIRRKIENNIIQIIEGDGRISIEIRKVDGGILDESKESDAEKVKKLAKQWLPSDLQPIDFHAVDGDAPRVAAWLTERKDKNDEDGVVMSICEAYSDGYSYKYEFVEYTPTVKRLIAAPYLFHDPIVENKPKETKESTPKHERIEIKKELTPEEKKHEVN